MKDYVSITHITSNEDGKQELILESRWSLWEAMWIALRGNPGNLGATRVESYIVNGTVWVEKDTGIVVDSDMQHELFECKGWIKQQEKFDEFFGWHQ